MIKKFLASLFLALWLPLSVQAAEINHTFVEVNTPQSITSTDPIAVTGAEIPSSFFSAGKKYLIYITAQVTNDTTNSRTSFTPIHGSTIFFDASGSQHRGTAGQYSTFSFMTVWTAVADEAIALQTSVSGNTGTIDQVAMFAMNLSDDLVENTDWFYNEDASDDSLTSTPDPGATITFTPGTAGHDWLVMGFTHMVCGGSTNACGSRLVRSGEASSSRPDWFFTGSGSNSKLKMTTISRVFNLGASSNTFTEESYVVAGTAESTRRHSAVFALNLNKFRNHSSAYTEADTNLGNTTNYETELASISITPDVQGNVWFGAYWGFDSNDAAREAEFRTQVDGADVPSGQTADNYQFDQSIVATSEEPFTITSLQEMTAAAHTIDLDASADGSGGLPAGQDRSLWAVTMELAAGGGGGGGDRQRRAIFFP